MADLMGELWQAVAIAWACFGFGVILFRMGCRDWHARYLSKALLFLSPFVLTCFGVHATRENQELAAIVAARKSEAIDERVYLASVARADLGDGIIYTAERYSNGVGQVLDANGRTAWSTDGLETGNATDSRMRRRLFQVPLRGQSEAGRSWHGSENL